MSALARANGWRGFDGVGDRVVRDPQWDGPDVVTGWRYRCDGLPTLFGCGNEVVVRRRWTTVGPKKDGWLVCYGLEPKTLDTRFDDPNGWMDDEDVVLTFCPRCAAVVKKQSAERSGGRV